jgi:hypothetical protein
MNDNITFVIDEIDEDGSGIPQLYDLYGSDDIEVVDIAVAGNPISRLATVPKYTATTKIEEPKIEAPKPKTTKRKNVKRQATLPASLPSQSVGTRIGLIMR